MPLLEVMAVMRDTNTGADYFFWGGETGTDEFYAVVYLIEEQLGANRVWHHPVNDTFVVSDDDDGCDMSYDYADLIGTIRGPAYSDEPNLVLRLVLIN
jgi:hypothetical protein